MEFGFKSLVSLDFLQIFLQSHVIVFYNNYMEVDFFQVVIIISVFSKPLQKTLFSQHPDYR